MSDKQVNNQRDYWRTASAFPEDIAPETGQAPPNTGDDAPSAAVSGSSERGSGVSHPLGVDCLLVGPPGSGKTSFVASLEQACLTNGNERDRLRLSFGTPLGPEVNEIVRQMMSEDTLSYRAATKPRTYSCDVDRSGSETFCALRIRDEPGSRLFSANGTRRKSLLAWLDRRSGGRRCMVIFVDPFCRTAAEWRLGLSMALHRLPEAERLEAVLVLISKIDLFCEQLRSCSTAIESVTGHRSTPLDLAHRIDPWQQAIELLGVASVELLRNAVSSPNDLAFGLISAAGFDIDSGRSLRESAQVLPNWELGKRWSPFGIYDALRFITFGEMSGHLAAPEVTRPIRSRWHSITIL